MKKTVLVCDSCAAEIADGKGAQMRVIPADARKEAKQADLCDDCSDKLPGQKAARRGRKPTPVESLVAAV